MKQVRLTHSRSIFTCTILAFYLTLDNPLQSMKQVHETNCRSILIYTILALYLTLREFFVINETST